MFSRYFFALCALALFAAVMSVSAEDTEVESVELDVEDRANAKATVVKKIIKHLFVGAAASCVVEAADRCKDHWKNPGKALSCAKNFAKANKGRCALG